jgi:uroporphyrinogen decarboxylase
MMTGRERCKLIISRKEADRCGFWLGNPHPDTLPIYHRYFGTSTLEELHRKLGSDLRWLSPQMMEGTYRHPRGEGLFDVRKYKKSLAEPGPLAECESVRDLDAYEWPDVEYLDFTESLAALREAGPYYIASGFWMPWFHDTSDLFGMEVFLTRMITHPELVESALARVCTFYYEANERFYGAAEDLIDGFFFGNDFGTQRGLLISPARFDQFFLPWIRAFAEQAHRHGLQVLMHSCGSVAEIIDRLIGAGIECLHPLQSLAHGMSAEALAGRWKGKIAFLGGIDTQELLVKGTPQEVRAEVRRVRELLGPSLIISPSHEALLPNVSPQNLAAMAEEACVS